MDALVHRIEDLNSREHLLPEGSGALVGVSGGLDSMVLLHVLHELAARRKWRLTVAHFNHQLRGAAANKDEQFVRREAKRMGLGFKTARADVTAAAVAGGLSVEMAARDLRHRFFANTARSLKLKHVFLAHHADDQVELFFLRLMCGAGSQGLGGMETKGASPVASQITLLRPLLGVRKSELLAFAEDRGIQFCEDDTNHSEEILRNRVRHRLLPMLRKDFTEGFERTVLRSMQLVREEGDFVASEALAWLNEAQEKEKFEKLHVALQRRILHLELLAHGVVAQFDYVERLRLCPNEWMAVGPEIVVRRTGQGRIERRVIRSRKVQPGEMTIELSQRRGIADFAGLKLRLSSIASGKLPPRRVRTEFFDEKRVGERVVLRHWRAGDRFLPIGMPQQVKLQDWFVNQKIPRECRHELVIATTAAGEIFWVEGLRIGERFKVSPQTTRILQWRWRR